MTVIYRLICAICAALTIAVSGYALPDKDTGLYPAAQSPGLKSGERHKQFYTANHYYESRDYTKAIDGYKAVIGMGLESGNLYYNIGNAYFKIGDLGHAILYYEKAARLIPSDSDLAANLSYARSLLADLPNDQMGSNFVISMVDKAFEAYSLRAIIAFAAFFYLAIILCASAMLLKPLIARRLSITLYVISAIFIINIAGLALRYYDEHMMKQGIILNKEVDCKYEPIEKSTTYYKAHEGALVNILKTGNDWTHIKRRDGKIGWVEKGSVEEI